jgi:hypothetical protein
VVDDLQGDSHPGFVLSQQQRAGSNVCCCGGVEKMQHWVCSYVGCTNSRLLRGLAERIGMVQCD